ncbi:MULTISPECIES: hypothetical protein [unclassified Cryobacterium]|uniref:hypothetical protein n=1 Tax=unclassified Cryobacterium TaxID=2649013 RepID=UPI001F54514C|nr:MULTISPECIES: hypothetical protein [unclassified Cryobacterium]
MEDTEVAELGRVRVAGEVDQLQVGHLVGAKPPGVGGLERDGIAGGGDSALATRIDDTLDLEVGEIEEVLQLTTRKRSFRRLLFILLRVGGPVEVGDDLSDGPAKGTSADFAPVVGRIGEEVAKQFEVGLIRPDGGLGQV